MSASLHARLAMHRARVVEAFAPPPVRHDDEVVQWHPLLLATKARATLAERLIDSVYADHAARVQDMRVTVACPAMADGMGDIVLAWRVCAALVQHVPGVRITLMVPDPQTAALPGATSASVDLVGPAGRDIAERCDLLIVTPSVRAARYASKSMHAWLDEAMRRYPALVVTEYGSGAAASGGLPTLATGLGPLVDGVFVDPHLRAVAGELRVAAPDTRRAAMQAWLAEALPAHAGPWQALHVIYVREPENVRHAVTRALLRVDAADPHTLMLVLRHTPAPEDIAAAAGAHVVAPGPLPGPRFREALMHADFAAVTGDQSLAEAIASQVPFAYEVRTHKQTLMHRLQEIASRIDMGVHADLTPLGEGPCVAQAGSVASWQAMCRHICAAYDATPSLVGRALRAAQNRPDGRVMELLIAGASDTVASGNDARLVQHLVALDDLLRRGVG